MGSWAGPSRVPASEPSGSRRRDPLEGADRDASPEEMAKRSFDALMEETLEELWQADPDGMFDLCLGSLSRTAAMMEEIVEETRADLETIEARRIAIDRTQAETRAILNEVTERMK